MNEEIMKVDSKHKLKPPKEIDVQIANLILELNSYANWLASRLPKSLARHVGSTDGDDLLQETYLESRKNCQRVLESPNPRAYLIGTMHNIVKTWRKTAIRRSHLSKEALGDDDA